MKAKHHAQVWLNAAERLSKESDEAPNERGAELVLTVAALAAHIGLAYAELSKQEGDR